MILQSKLILGSIALIATGLLPVSEAPQPQAEPTQESELGDRFRIQTEVYFVSNPATIAAIEALSDDDARNAKARQLFAADGSGAERLLRSDAPALLDSPVRSSGDSKVPIFKKVISGNGKDTLRHSGTSNLHSEARILVQQRQDDLYTVSYSVHVQQAAFKKARYHERREHDIAFSTRLTRGSSMVQFSTPNDAQGTIIVLTNIQ